MDTHIIDLKNIIYESIFVQLILFWRLHELKISVKILVEYLNMLLGQVEFDASFTIFES